MNSKIRRYFCSSEDIKKYNLRQHFRTSLTLLETTFTATDYVAPRTQHIQQIGTDNLRHIIYSYSAIYSHEISFIISADDKKLGRESNSQYQE